MRNDSNTPQSSTGKDVFVASLYFLIPVHGIKDACMQRFDKNRRLIPNSSFIKRLEGTCHYMELETDKRFYYTSRFPDRAEEVRPVSLGAYLLSYMPRKDAKNRQFYVVVKTCIDKVFYDRAFCRCSPFCHYSDYSKLIMLYYGE